MSPRFSTRLLQTQSDERLAGAAAAGHERAFEALVQRYRKHLLRYCRQLGLPEARAEDVLQQALMKAWISLQRGAEVRDVSAWLYRIVHNAAIDAHRGADATYEQLTSSAEEVPAARADPERAFAMRETLAGVAALPALQREALLCTAVEGYSNEQAALALGLSGGAVRGLVYRARVALRAAASAVTPPAVLTWAEQAGRRSASLAERLGSVGAGSGTAGVATSALLKGGGVVLTAGALFAGAATIRHVYGTATSGVAAGTPRVSATSAATGRHGLGAFVLTSGSRGVTTTDAGAQAHRQTSSAHALERSDAGTSGLGGGAVNASGNGGGSRAGGSGAGRSPTESPGPGNQATGTNGSRQEPIVMGAAAGGPAPALGAGAGGARQPGESTGNNGGSGSGSGGSQHGGDDGDEGVEGGVGSEEGGKSSDDGEDAGEAEGGGQGGEDDGKTGEGAGQQVEGSKGGEASRGEEDREDLSEHEPSPEGDGREATGGTLEPSERDGRAAETGEAPRPH